MIDLARGVWGLDTGMSALKLLVFHSRLIFLYEVELFRNWETADQSLSSTF
jgi:hypothetical protein